MLVVGKGGLPPLCFAKVGIDWTEQERGQATLTDHEHANALVGARFSRPRAALQRERAFDRVLVRDGSNRPVGECAFDRIARCAVLQREIVGVIADRIARIF